MKKCSTSYLSPKFFIFSIVVFLHGCSQPENLTLFSSLTPDKTNIHFFNEVVDKEDFNIFTYRNYYNGGGVAIGDINNDGLADIYFTANMGPNKLYLNKGNWEFEDITDQARVAGFRGWSTGVTMADINGDGLLDIYVCNSGDVKGDNKENELFINKGNLRFEERASDFGLNDNGFTTHASFFDYDLDGDLDCYMLNNSFKSVDRVEQFMVSRDERDSLGDKLLRNENGIFTDVSEEAGIYGSWIGFGLGVSVSDLNADLLPDIYISNDFWERDYLYINKGDGTFSEEIITRTETISASSMGSDIADLNNDGYPEVFTTDMLPGDNRRLKVMTRFDETNMKELKVKSSYHYQILKNSLHFNDGEGVFQETAFLSNTAATDWSWGALIFDMDNDGWKDIYVSNGMFRDITSMDFVSFVNDKEQIKQIVMEKGKFDYKDLLSHYTTTKIPNYAFLNQRNRTFRNLADTLGLGQPSFSNGAAYGDLDNDGDYDLIVNNVNMPAFIYRNNTDTLVGNNFLKVAFIGPAKNPFGIGAKVTLYADGQQQAMQNFTTRGFESSVEPQLLFGVGKALRLDSVVVMWPDKGMQTIENVATNQLIAVDHSQARERIKQRLEHFNPLFTDVTYKMLKGNHHHRENEFNDFNYERLLPRKLSTEGPRIIAGDANGDGLEDFLLPGAYGDYDKLFLQNANGTFAEKIQQDFLMDSIFESTCGVFFDPDNDGDADLLIGSGGNEFDRGVESHFLRYYLNLGDGKYERVLGRVPSVAGNFSCILAEDFDEDGDEDLFIGARVIPGNYGLIPRSFLYKNEGQGRWTEVTPESLAGAGMITDAVWSDFDGDSKKDLMVVGEWMSVMIYKNVNGQLGKGHQIEGTSGWWCSIEAADLNNDGSDDYILGNWGLNSKFKANQTRPLTMHVKDFDRNGKSEFIISWYPPEEDQAYPFASKTDLTAQLPVLKKKAVTYEDYAENTYQTLFDDAQKENVLEYKVNYLQSAVLWNRSGSYELKELPLEAQVAPVYSVIADDLDEDGFKDLLLMGNFHGLKPEVGRHDSNKGVYLKGDGCGGFIYVTNKHTGIKVEGEVRDAAILSISGEKSAIIIARNDRDAIVYSKRSDKQAM